MGSRAPLLLVLLLLVSAPLSVLAEHAVDDAPEDASQTSAEPLTEEQRLAMAAAHWSMMPHATMEPVALMPSTGCCTLLSARLIRCWEVGRRCQKGTRVPTMQLIPAW